MTQNQSRHFRFLISTCFCMGLLAASSAVAAARSSKTWVHLSPSISPPARSYLAMTYDPAGGKIIMFGGFDGTGYLNDTWTFDGTSWTHVQTSLSPSARGASQMSDDDNTQQVLALGCFK